MGKLVTRVGTLDKVAITSPNINEDPRIVNTNENIDGTADKIDQLSYIKDTFTTLTSINPTRFSDEYLMLQAYPEGTPIVIRYFNQVISNINTKTHSVNIAELENPLHLDLTEYRNLEIRLLSSLDIDVADEDNFANLSGEAILYPGFTPVVSDQFLYEVGNNKIGVFIVDNVTPTTYRQGKYFKISFNILGFLDNNFLKELSKRVSEVLYFDREVYFNSGTFKFLNSQSYLDLKYLQQLRKDIITYYMDTYYSDELKSVIRVDKLYDPYLAEFLKSKISMFDYPKRIKQLYSRNLNYKSSLFYMLQDKISPVWFSRLVSTYDVYKLKNNANATDHNGLLNKDFVMLIDKVEGKVVPKVIDGIYYQLDNYEVFRKEKDKLIYVKEGVDLEKEIHYIFSYNFYQENVMYMTDLEKILYDLIFTGKIDIYKCKELFDQYYKLNLDDAFYFLPIYIHLIDSIIIQIK